MEVEDSQEVLVTVVLRLNLLNGPLTRKKNNVPEAWDRSCLVVPMAKSIFYLPTTIKRSIYIVSDYSDKLVLFKSKKASCNITVLSKVHETAVFAAGMYIKYGQLEYTVVTNNYVHIRKSNDYICINV
jgi:hypothetical protein